MLSKRKICEIRFKSSAVPSCDVYVVESKREYMDDHRTDDAVFMHARDNEYIRGSRPKKKIKTPKKIFVRVSKIKKRGA